MLAWRCSPVPGLQLAVGHVAVIATVVPSGHCLRGDGQVAPAATTVPSGHRLEVGHVAVAATVDPSEHRFVAGRAQPGTVGSRWQSGAAGVDVGFGFGFGVGVGR